MAMTARQAVARNRIAIAGEEIVLDPSGVAFWPCQSMLVVADLHLEKGSSFARRRVFLPPYDTAATLSALAAAVDHYRPRTVLCLGDSFHDGQAESRLAPTDRAAISAMQAGRAWVWITGNHDPRAPGSMAGDSCEVVAAGGLVFRHHPEAGPAPGEVAGHLHPSGKVRGRGRSVRRRCFATDGRRIVLPAFGAYTGGLNVLDRAWTTIFPDRRFNAILLGRDRLFSIPGSALQRD